MNGYKKISPELLSGNSFKMIGQDWMLVTAKNSDGKINTMTASWGGVGILWNDPVAFVFVRPQRYTKQFMDKEGYFTLSMFDESHRSDLAYLGMYSGKDVDKVKATGISPVFSENGVYFEEANTVFVCRKLYQAPIVEEGFVDKTLLQENYPNKDYHEVYIGEIVDILVKE